MNAIIRPSILFVLFIGFGLLTKAQDGANDPTFDPGTGANNITGTVCVQNDGKILVGGGFTSFNGSVHNHIVRLNTDGSIDQTFDSGTGTDGGIVAIIEQSDGTIMIGGNFSSYNGITVNNVARLFADGSLDQSFDPGSGGGGIQSLAIQADGKIIVIGSFTWFGGVYRSSIVRLNTNGSVDPSFGFTASGVDGDLYTVSLQSDGKVIIGGYFEHYGNDAVSNIARLNSNGTLDASFNIGTGADSDILTSTIQSDGKIVIGGAFSSYNGTTRNYLARINTDGSIDGTFDTGTGPDGIIDNVVIDSQGRLIMVGSIYSYNGTNRADIIRVNSDGSLDQSFNSGTGATGSNSWLARLALQSDGKIVVVGKFTGYNGASRNNVARIESSITVGVSPITSNETGNTAIYPNPSSGSFNIQLGTVPANGSSIVFTDMLGREVFNSSLLNSSQLTVEAGTLGTGVFFVHLRQEDGIKYLGKVVLVED